MFLRALALHRENRLAEAEAAYELALEAEPAHVEALCHYSLLRAAQGRHEEALELVRRAIALRPDSGPAHAQAGGLLALLNRPHEALEELKYSLTLAPDRPETLNNLGAVLRSLGRLDDAQACFARASELAPGYGAAANNLARSLSSEGRYDQAIEHFEALVAAGRRTPETFDELGKALWKAGRDDEAVGAFREAVARDPRHADAWGHLGNVLVEQGRLEEAERAFLAAIGAAPQRAQFYRFLAETNPSAVTGAHVAALENAAAGGAPPNERIEAHFALGTILAARGERRTSFDHLLAGNALARGLGSYDEAATLAAFERIAEVFSASFVAARRGSGHPSELPIFIVGMPRSGTTLIEQIVASHPDAYGAGELPLFEDTANAVLGRGGPISPEAMLGASRMQLRDIGERYAASLATHGPASIARITDKMPANFRFAGLIHLALPGARIIHARRDLLDTCLSCFSRRFAAEGMAWSYDLGELGRYARGYRRLMEHWHAVLPPGAMLDVSYEELVADLEGQARRILAYCGLPWDARVVEYYASRRPVRTASAVGVRRPIYRDSVHRSREYGDLLRPLLDALGA